MTQKKEITIIDSHLFSGSSNRVRNLFGSFYKTSGDQAVKINDFNTSITTEQLPFGSFENVLFKVTLTATSGSFEDDREWETYLLGGTYKNATYLGALDFEKHFDHSTKLNSPISREDVKRVEDSYLQSYIDRFEITDPDFIETARARIDSRYVESVSVTPSYNNYFSRYQQQAALVESERLLPNFYFLYLSDSNDDTSYEEFIQKLVRFEVDSLEGEKFRDTSIETDSSFSYGESNTALAEYMNFSFVNHEYSSNLKQEAIQKQENLIVTDQFVDTITEINNTKFISVNPDTLDDTKLSYEFMPFGNLIRLQDVSDNVSLFKTFLSTYRLEDKVLVTLKDLFYDDRQSLPTANFSIQDQIESGEITLQQNVEASVVDINDFFTTMLENYSHPDRNYTILSKDADKRRNLSDETGRYRFFNSSIIDFTYKRFKDFNENNLVTLPATIEEAFSERLGMHHNEVLAYRVAKTTVNGTEEDTVSNFWFFDKDKAIEYFDSQVKYNKTYNYKIFQYVLVAGLCHQVVSAKGTRLYNEVDGQYCLSYFDLKTGKALTTTGVDNDLILEKTETYNRFECEFDIAFERSIKIVELPVHEKTISTLDHPANMLVPTISHVQNNEDKVSFFVNYEIFSSRTKTYPRVLTQEEETYRERYLSSYSLSDTDKLPFESRSPPRYVEIFRTTDMPKSYDDFAGQMVRRIDLQFDKNRPPVRTFEFFQKLKTNQKYYFTMRALNQNFVNGYFSPIYEIELVNDGGYVYSKIESYFENTLPSQIKTKPSETIGNFLLIRPTENNFLLNTDNVDFTDKAENQIGNLIVGDQTQSNVWGKRFKFRLTSKKTGKKIDINIDYKIDS
jgi:hypothetical protein